MGKESKRGREDGEGETEDLKEKRRRKRKDYLKVRENQYNTTIKRIKSKRKKDSKG